MEKENIVIVKKRSTFWSVVKFLLVVGAICFVAVKIYQKHFQKKEADAVNAAEEPTKLDCSDALEETPSLEEPAFEVSAEAVITNTEDMADVTSDEA